MNIAMIGQKGIPAIVGGVERHVHELSVRLVRHGHDVTVYSRAWYTSKKSIQTIDRVQVKPVPSIRTKHFDTITHTLLATIDAIRCNFQVIHYHGVGPALWSWLPRLFQPKATVITTFHCLDRKHEKWGYIAKRVLKLGEWAACRFAHQTIVVSNTLAQYARDVYDTKAIYIPNGADTASATKKPDLLEPFGLEPQGYILAVSRLIPHKGIAELIQAWNHLYAHSADVINGKKLVIVGSGHYTDAYVQILRNLAKANPSIIFTDYQHGESLHNLYAHAWGFVHPSRSEGLPLVVLEAMSFGLPMLLSDIAEHKELGVDQLSLFSVGNVQALAEGLSRLLRIDEQTRASIKKFHQSIVEQKYSWDKIATQTSMLYHSALKANRQNPAEPEITTISSLPS